MRTAPAFRRSIVTPILVSTRRSSLPDIPARANCRVASITSEAPVRTVLR